MAVLNKPNGAGNPEMPGYERQHKRREVAQGFSPAKRRA
jgi:hypothetical protein